MMHTAPIDIEMQQELMMLNQMNNFGMHGDVLQAPQQPGQVDDDCWSRLVTCEPDCPLAPEEDEPRESYPFMPMSADPSRGGMAPLQSIREEVLATAMHDLVAREEANYDTPGDNEQAATQEFRKMFCKHVDKAAAISALDTALRGNDLDSPTAARNNQLRRRVFRGSDTEVQEGVLDQLGLEGAHPPPADAGTEGERRSWSWPESADVQELERVKKALKQQLFSGIERALQTGEMEEALNEIAYEAHAGEAASVRKQYAQALWQGVERALNNGSMQSSLEAVAQDHEAESRHVTRADMGLRLMANLERSVADGSLERALAELSFDEEEE